MTTTLLQYEFNATDRNPNANGDQRLLTVTQTGDSVRMVITGLQGHGMNARLVTLSDETVPVSLWNTHKELFLKGRAIL